MRDWEANMVLLLGLSVAIAIAVGAYFEAGSTI